MIGAELERLVKHVQHEKAGGQCIEILAAQREFPSNVYQTLSAFSNQKQGGIILFGLDPEDECKSCGVYDAEDIREKLMELCGQMEPELHPVITALSCENGNTVISVEIPGIAAGVRPCFYRGGGKLQGAFVRVGAENVQMTAYEVSRYEALCRDNREDARICEPMNLCMIDPAQVDCYLKRVIMKRPGLTKFSQEELREILNLSVKEKPTLACILMFSVCPQLCYPRYVIEATAVPENDNRRNSRNGSGENSRQIIEGTIPEMLEGAMKFLKGHMKRKMVEGSGSERRREQFEYSVDALREAVLNALIHRDYSIYTENIPISINICEDRIEIQNPGGFYEQGEIGDGELQEARNRNLTLIQIAETMGLMKNRDSGIPMIRKEACKAEGERVLFSSFRGHFSVTFYRGKREEECSKAQDAENRLLEFCKVPRSRKEISEFLGISTIFYISRNYLDPLVEAGKLAMTIPEHPKSKRQKFYRAKG